MITFLFLKYLVTSSSIFLNDKYLTLNSKSHSEFGFRTVGVKADDWAHDYTNIHTFAKMSHNAYLNINDTRWIDTSTNKTTDIRYSDETVHAYLFSDISGSVNVVSFKGTSLGIVGSITYNDRFNDNLFYSCCYYKQSRMFDTCDVSSDVSGVVDKTKCYGECYQNSTQYANNYYVLSKAIIGGVFDSLSRSTDAITLLTGHSLGGTLATLMGLEYDLPVVTFNSPGERHYVEMSGIGYKSTTLEKIFHYGHDADIIFTGKCHGALSWCSVAGYVVETTCHLGKTCVYNATGELGVGESIFTHPINYVLKNIIPHWEEKMPACSVVECEECTGWEYV
jgi:lipase ATG15